MTFPGELCRCGALTEARLSDPDTGERLCHECFTAEESIVPEVVVPVSEASQREAKVRERLTRIAYEGVEADHDFTMELRYYAEERGHKRGPLHDLALLLELNDDRAKASPATYAREFLELMGPPR